MESIESNAAACPNSRCNEYLDFLRSNDVCPKCKAVVTNEQVDRFHEVVELTKMHLDKMKDIACKSVNLLNVREVNTEIEPDEMEGYVEVCVVGVRAVHSTKYIYAQ